MAGNKNLHKAKSAKNDEFYTQYQDIEREMQAYLEYDENVFRGKTILLPCDDPEWSNFTKYFLDNFNELGLKRLVSTSYLENGKGKILDIDDINSCLKWDYLEGDGDFRSEEVTNIAKEADMIITNPPFSLFREFFAWIVGMGKQFSIIGNTNAITYKEVFPLIKDNKMWLGSKGILYRTDFIAGESVKEWVLENNKKGSSYKIADGNVVLIVTVAWFTNIEHGCENEPLQLMSMEDNLRYNKKVIKNKETKNTIYQKYDNYDAIEVGYTNAIPSDYDGVMGVPISFLDKYCPEQFEILGCSISTGEPIGYYNGGGYEAKINSKRLFKRIFIKHKESEIPPAEAVFY